MKSLFVDLEFPRGRGDQVKKSWKFQVVGEVTSSPLERKILGGGGSNWKKPSVGGGGRMDIFWNHTIAELNDRRFCYVTVAMFVSLRRAQTWRLHTKIYKLSDTLLRIAHE